MKVAEFRGSNAGSIGKFMPKPGKMDLHERLAEVFFIGLLFWMCQGMSGMILRHFVENSDLLFWRVVPSVFITTLFVILVGLPKTFKVYLKKSHRGYWVRVSQINLPNASQDFHLEVLESPSDSTEFGVLKPNETISRWRFEFALGGPNRGKAGRIIDGHMTGAMTNVFHWEAFLVQAAPEPVIELRYSNVCFPERKYTESITLTLNGAMKFLEVVEDVVGGVSDVLAEMNNRLAKSRQIIDDVSAEKLALTNTLNDLEHRTRNNLAELEQQLDKTTRLKPTLEGLELKVMIARMYWLHLCRWCDDDHKFSAKERLLEADCAWSKAIQESAAKARRRQKRATSTAA